ncbi:hypothetical protein RJ640_006025, partial [Escallonia rubra]
MVYSVRRKTAKLVVEDPLCAGMANNPQTSGAQSLRPPAAGPMVSHNFGPSYGTQFQPLAPSLQGQSYIPAAPALQQFRPVAQGMLPSQSQPQQLSQPMQQLPFRPGQLGHATPSSQSIPMPYIQQNMGFTSASSQFQQTAPPNNHVPGVGGPGVPLSSAYTFTPSSFGQPQNTMNMSPHFQSVSQMHAPVVPVGGQPWLPSGSQGAPFAPMQQIGQQHSATVATVPAVNASNTAEQTSSDWQECENEGKRYYYNKKTKQSSWEKPLELMTAMERADASTVWKEFTTSEGRKYYYNKVTKQSKWTIPEELKVAREQAEKPATQVPLTEMTTTSSAPPSVMPSTVEQSSTTPSLASFTISSAISGVAASPVPVTPVVADVNASTLAVSESSTPVVDSAVGSAVGASSLGNLVTSSPAVVPGNNGGPVSLANNTTSVSSFEDASTHDAANSVDGASVEDIEEAKKGMAVAGKINVTPLEEKTVEEEPLVYANKQDAKNAFKALLESANVEADWSWEQAMRVIINDRRYGALKTLGERKQAFNEYLMQRKKLEAEERRMRQRKAREEFIKMLEESKDLTSSTRWSKAVTMFEDDDRFKAVDRPADREDLYKNYLVDLEKKEKTKAQEEYRQNRVEYRKFLETCGLIKVDTQWRKVQDRLEDDERCSRLEKFDRLEIFQEYIRELEKEEDELKRTAKEQLKRAERRNRDEFRKMMEEHVAAGTFTAKTHWREYCQQVKDSGPYQAIASNTSGSTPKDLFDYVSDELEKKYHEDKTRVKDAVKLAKAGFLYAYIHITVVSTWTFEDFKAAILEEIGSPPLSDINLQLVFEDLLERAKEKEEKEAKKRQRLTKEFIEALSEIKEITGSSNWEECKELIEDISEYRSIGEESLAKEIFEEYVAGLQEKAKEKERRREEEKAKKEKEREEKEKRKEKERREKEKEKEKEKEREREKEKEKEREKEKEKEREREREKEKGKDRPKKDETETENIDVADSYGPKEDKKREKERERKHRKRHLSSADDVSSDKDEKDDSKRSRRHGSDRHQGAADDVVSDKDEKEDSKKSRRHGSDRKKSRKHAYTPESDSESRHKKHKKDYRDVSRSRNGGYEELEDGELGEDGEI